MRSICTYIYGVIRDANWLVDIPNTIILNCALVSF